MAFADHVASLRRSPDQLTSYVTIDTPRVDVPLASPAVRPVNVAADGLSPRAFSNLHLLYTGKRHGSSPIIERGR